MAECYDVQGMFAIEVKYRKSLPKWLTEGYQQACDFGLMIRKPYHLLIVNTHRKDRMQSMVVLSLEHFDWIMRQADIKPPDLNKENVDT